MKLTDFAVKLISTFFYIGYLPLIPGTFGSLAGLLIYFLIMDSVFVQFFLILVLIILGLWSGSRAEALFNKKDSRYIVIDEVAGMLLSLLFVPYGIKSVIAAFFLFRLLDTIKPFPANRIQDLKGGAGVMGDDIVAGLYTNIILQAIFRFASFSAS